MNQSWHGQPPTLMDMLKASTHAFHERLQAAPYFQALADGRLPIESYVAQLQALAVVHAVLEHEIEKSPNDAVTAVWQPDMLKLPALLEDLSYFEPRFMEASNGSVDQALKIAKAIRLLALQEPLALLGYVYVLEGSMLGAQILMPKFAHAFKLAKDEGLSYFNCYGSDPLAQWSKYRQRMNALMLGAEGKSKVVQAACEFFQLIESVFVALFPLQSSAKGLNAVAINPDAGRHPVPSDRREVQAAKDAALLCWQRFPYFELRYGERGMRFAKSDGAWLVTLCQYDQARIDQQVQWLGRVLAARGMPTLLLQVHLEILADRLVAAIPENHLSYQKLLVAATRLREKRCELIDDDCSRTLDEEFDQSVGPIYRERVGHAGSLLAAAVADELNGSAGSVDSIRQWMTDASRFDSVWINIVEETLAKAYAYAHLRKGPEHATDKA